MSFRPSRSGFRWIRRRTPRASIAALVLVFLGIGTERRITGRAMAQDEVRNFKKPILTVETGGHHARVRSLVWQDDFTLSERR